MRILHAAIAGVDPEALVSTSLADLHLPPHERVYLLGIGKAAESMVRGAARVLPDYAAGIAVTKQRTSASMPPRIQLLEAGHPVPDERSEAAGGVVLEFVSRLEDDDLLFCLISGGASSLVVAPIEGVSLGDIRIVTDQALRSGASIDEINIIRRMLDRIKGGGLAAASDAAIFSLILSDVMGDRLESIGSGPTVLSPTGPADALAVVSQYCLQLPQAVLRALARPAPLVEPNRAVNIIIGNNVRARRAAIKQAEQEQFSASQYPTELAGEASEVGVRLAAELVRQSNQRPRPFCIVAGGETTVRLDAVGKGGRNQELALAAVDTLKGVPDCLLISLATDGNDGPTDAAGAVVTGESAERGQQLGMSSQDFLGRHDSYSYFAALGDLLKPGYTGTNVNDLALLIGL